MIQLEQQQHGEFVGGVGGVGGLHQLPISSSLGLDQYVANSATNDYCFSSLTWSSYCSDRFYSSGNLLYASWNSTNFMEQ